MKISVKSRQKTELIDVTREVEKTLAKGGIKDGFCFLYVPHTTAGITINESADPSVKADILMILNQIIPWHAGYGHMEGNSPAHIKSSIIGASEWVAVENGRLVLGTWQGIFFCEFDGPRNRTLQIKLLSA
jgi:secondary thiamine-phosphate synthase enzyme